VEIALISGLVLTALVFAGTVLFLLDRSSRARTALQEEAAGLRTQLADLDRSLAVERVRSAKSSELERDIQRLTQRADALRQEKSDFQAIIAERAATISGLHTDISALKGQVQKLETAQIQAGQTRDEINAAKADLQAELARTTETLEQERAQNEDKLKLLREAREEMTREFKLLANTVIQENAQTFSQQNKEQIDAVLSPLRERLSEFQLGLSAAQTESAKDRAALAEQIRQLSHASAAMTNETTNLTRALTAKAQTQGAWGEMILSTILEKSGLRKGEEYFVQTSHTTDEGQRLRPDVIVNLPGGQRIVIDAKVSLTAFEAYVNATTDEDRQLNLQKHIASVRGHIKALASKGYQVHTNSAVDYVIMFVPVEGALAVALQEVPAITSEAVAQNVNLATPTTLMIALRTAASVWQVERRNQNAEAIAARAGQLYDKFVGFVDDMNGLGGRIDQAQGCFHDAMNKLCHGAGNIVRQVDQLKTLGAKSKKTLPAYRKAYARSLPCRANLF
jgi:DNA recombination protein RmuC